MIRWLIVVGLILTFGGQAHQAEAKSNRVQLYRVQRSAMPQVILPGTAVPGLPAVRALTQPGQTSLLTVSERQSVQDNLPYRAMFTPNDPHFVLQWNLQAMHVPSAWDVDQLAPVHGGDARIIVAVLDTGLASTLVGGAQSVPDITASTIWTNTAEVAGDGLDNDHDGYIDDIHGWNFVAHTARPFDDNGHGTHIAGVIAGAMDNAVATAGIASNVTIMPLKVLDNAGLGSTATLTAAVNFAVAHGATIINLSLGGDEDDPIFHQALQSAVSQGVVVIAAAGNSGQALVTYPAAYSEVIGVGATNTDNTRASYSNYGSALALVAPGGDTNLDLNVDGQPDGVPAQTCTTGACTAFATVYLSGTSQAASEVSAVAALLESCGTAPGNVRSILTSSAIDLGAAGRDDVFGYGLVDASAALTMAGCVASVPSQPGAITATANRTSALKVQAGHPSPYTKPVFSWSGQSGITYAITWKKGSSTLSKVKQATASFSPTVSDEGAYTISVAAVDPLGQTSPATTFAYRYQKPVLILTSGSKVTLLSGQLKSFRTFSAAAGKVVSLSAGALGRSFTNRLLAANQPQGATLAVLDTTGRTLSRVTPFGSAFSGSIAAAVMHMAGGQSTFVAGTLTDGASIAWYSSAGKLLGRNLVFAKYGRGLSLAAGDLDGDGTDELVVAMAGGPDIAVYSADRKKQSTFSPRGKKFQQGWSMTCGDTNGDGLEEIIVTPNVPTKASKILLLSGTGKELRNFSISGSTAGSLVIQALDITGDGRTEIATAPRHGAGVLRILTATGTMIKQLQLPSASFRSLAGL